MKKKSKKHAKNWKKITVKTLLAEIKFQLKITRKTQKNLSGSTMMSQKTDNYCFGGSINFKKKNIKVKLKTQIYKTHFIYYSYKSIL